MNDLWPIPNESRKTVLHPRIADLVRQESKTKILDYGCGDGSMIMLLNKCVEVSLFDIDQSALSIAEKKLQEWSPVCYRNSALIPRNYFDYIICSLVIMEISEKEAISSALTDIHSMLNAKGELLLAITHPCFRQYSFSTFHTSYSYLDNFNYFDEGKEFQVFITDPSNNEIVNFFDYHWSLSTQISFILNAGFKLVEMIELKDKSFCNSYFNDKQSPFIIFRVSK